MSEFLNKKRFIKLYDKYHAGIYRFLFVKVPTREIAQDLTSETFTKVWDAVCKNPDILKENPRAYLYKTAYNCMADHYRNSKTQKEFAVGEPEVLASLASSDPSRRGEAEAEATTQLGDEIDLDIEKKRMVKALKQMSGQSAELLTLRYIEDLTNAEIAEILGKKEGAVRTALSRAIQELREKV